MALLEFKARRLRLLLQDRSTSGECFIRPSDIKHKTSNYASMNSPVRTKRFEPPGDTSLTLGTCAPRSNPLSAPSPSVPWASPKQRPDPPSSITHSETARFRNEALTKEASKNTPPRLINNQSNMIDLDIARIRKKINAERQYVVSHDLSYRRSSSPTSMGRNHVYDDPPVPTTSRRPLHGDVTRRTSGKHPTSRTEERSFSTHHKALLDCRQRLILHEVRRLGRQRGFNERIHHGKAIIEEPLIRPSRTKVALQRKSRRRILTEENAMSHHTVENDFSSRVTSNSAIDDIPFDQMLDEFKARSREDLLNQAQVSIKEGRAYIHNRERGYRSTMIEGSVIRKAIHSSRVADDDVNEREKSDVAARAQAMADEPRGSTVTLSGVYSPPHITRVHKGRETLEGNQAFSTLNDTHFSVLQHRSYIPSQMGDVDSRSGPDYEDDNDATSSGSTKKVSNVMPRQRDVTFDEKDLPSRIALADQDPGKEQNPRTFEGGVPSKNLRSVDGGKKVSLWKKFSKRNDRIPLICGGWHHKSNARLSTSAITTYSSSSDRSSVSVTDSFQQRRKPNGAASVTTSSHEESAATKSSKNQLGKLMCLLHEKESSDWCVSQHQEDTKVNLHDSIMEMVFFD